MTTAALVLAAGSSNRLGSPKQLVPIDGRPLVRHIVEAAASSSCDAVCVVLGAHAPRIEGALAGLDVVCLNNVRWIEGMASSIRAGVAWADTQGFDAVVVMVADQLRVTRDHLDALVRAAGRGATMAASRYCGVIGVPAVFARPHFPALMSLVGDRGARDVLRANPDVLPIDFEDGALDLDTRSDLLRVIPRRVPTPPERRARRTTPRARARSR